MKLASLQDLFVDELRDLYSAETQLVKALPRIADEATSSDLRTAIQEHLVQTRGHVERLDRIFTAMGEKREGNTCKGMVGLLEEGEEFLREDATPTVRDAGLISKAQRVEHYEIAGYGTVRTYAEQLGNHEAAHLLAQTLAEEKQANHKLTEIAEHQTNRRAGMV